MYEPFFNIPNKTYFSGTQHFNIASSGADLLSNAVQFL